MKTQNLKLVAIAFLFILASCAEKVKKTEEKVETIVETMAAPVYSTDDPQSMLSAIEYSHGSW